MKKHLSVFLAVVLLCCFVSSVGITESENISGLFSYRVKGNDSAIITDFNWEGNGNQDIYIPKLIDGYEVTEIGAGAFSNESVGYDWDNKHEKFKRTGVGQKVAVVIPDTIKTIGEKAFFCTDISSVLIPASVQSIGKGVFGGCTNILKYAVDSNNPVYATIDGALYDKTKKELISYPYTKNVNIPEGIVSIGDYALYGFVFDDHFELPSTVTKCGAYSFAFSDMHCNYAVRDNGPMPFTDIGEGAFTYTVFGWVNFGKSRIEHIGDDAFAYAKIKYLENYHDVVFPASLKTIGARSFMGLKAIGQGDSILYLDLSRTSVTVIPEYAFSNVYYFSGNGAIGNPMVLLPESLLEISSHAFDGIHSLGSDYPIRIIIPSSTERIDKGAFQSAESIEIVFNSDSNLKQIDDEAFLNAFILQDKIDLPNGIERIGASAFKTRKTPLYGFNVPEHPYVLYIPSTVNEIGDDLCDRSIVTLSFESGSYAETYATENGYGTQGSTAEDSSWLNN